MAKAYTNVNSTTGTFAGWLSKANELYYDMSTMIVTVADVSAPNSSNEARTTGNADIQGIFSANNIVVWDTLAGGRNEEWANTDTLYIVSNTQIGNSSQTDTLTVYGDATFDANVQIGSAATDGLTIAANTVVNGLSFFTANTRFNDNARISFGTDSDTSLYHDGSDLKLIHNNANTSDFIIEDVSGNDDEPYESGLLKLNCDKALHFMNWRAVMEFDETVKMTAEWYDSFYSNPKNIFDITNNQLDEYTKLAQDRGLDWA
jgi:hypothetical protein